MNRLPLSFHPLVDNATTFNRHIDQVKYSSDSNTVILGSKGSNRAQPTASSTHDYAILSVPFSVLRNWQIDGLSPIMREAIVTLPYSSACKVALEFRTRFWEHSPRPVYGACWAPGPKFPGVGTICYPSYNINGTGKAAVLASYVSDPAWGNHWATKSEREHVSYVLNAMVGHHGNIVKRQYTGKHSRVCWDLDPLEGAGWADPTAEQQRKYLPEYFKTHNNVRSLRFQCGRG
jgi:monoamine oxidase